MSQHYTEYRILIGPLIEVPISEDLANFDVDTEGIPLIIPEGWDLIFGCAFAGSIPGFDLANIAPCLGPRYNYICTIGKLPGPPPMT